MCSIFYPGEIFLENASCYRVIALHTRRTREKVVISCSTFSNVDHCYCGHDSTGVYSTVHRYLIAIRYHHYTMHNTTVHVFTTSKGRSGKIARPITSRIAFYCNSRSSRIHQVLSYHVVSLASLQA